MPNRKLANEWLAMARKNLETAILLNRENHYTDVISIDVQQSVEKTLKAVYAFNGEKIPRTHSLEILFNYASDFIIFEDVDIKKLFIISDYYQTERYPVPKYFMPEREEINNSLEFAKSILGKVNQHINQN